MVDYLLAHELTEKVNDDGNLYEDEIIPLLECLAHDEEAHGDDWALLGWTHIAYLKAKEMARVYQISDFKAYFDDDTLEEAGKELQALFDNELELFKRKVEAFSWCAL